MRPYLAYIAVTLKLAWRDKMVIFFNYLFPLIFFFIFAQLGQAEQGGSINSVYSSVLVIGVLGNGFFGGGIRAVVDREQNILRRFKVAPISPAPILVSAVVVGMVNYLPSALLTFLIAHFHYGMPIPERWISALLFIAIGTMAFRAMGQIIASVANSMAESQIIIQSLYFPMLMLSGAAVPLSFLPDWVQIITQFIPASYLFNGMQNILVRHESLADNLVSVIALVITTGLCIFISMRLFRWEKGEKLKPAAKLSILAMLLPFLFVGAYQVYSKDNILKAKSVAREIQRSRSLLIRDARIFAGDGKVIDSASVLVRQGKIAEIYIGTAPDADELRAEPVDASGKTLLPGLIDPFVMLSSTGGAELPSPRRVARELAAYIFSGVVAVGSSGDSPELLSPEIRSIKRGETLGADIYFSGPVFAAQGNSSSSVYTPGTPEEARKMVQSLKQAGASMIRSTLDNGTTENAATRLDVSILRAIADECDKQTLKLVVSTASVQNISDALDAGAHGILFGSPTSKIPDNIFERMKAQSVTLIPSLTTLEAQSSDLALLERSLVEQIGPPELLSATRQLFRKPATSADLTIAMENLQRAHRSGVELVTGSGSGNKLVLHGPGIHRELYLWVKAGIPAAVALEAATSKAAKFLDGQDQLGLIAPGRDASLLLVNGNPLQEITATEAISLVVVKGERINRSDIFDKTKF